MKEDIFDGGWHIAQEKDGFYYIRVYGADPGAPARMHELAECYDKKTALIMAAANDLFSAGEKILSEIPTLWGDRIIGGKSEFTLSADAIMELESAINRARGIK